MNVWHDASVASRFFSVVFESISLFERVARPRIDTLKCVTNVIASETAVLLEDCGVNDRTLDRFIHHFSFSLFSFSLSFVLFCYFSFRYFFLLFLYWNRLTLLARSVRLTTSLTTPTRFHGSFDSLFSLDFIPLGLTFWQLSSPPPLQRDFLLVFIPPLPSSSSLFFSFYPFCWFFFSFSFSSVWFDSVVSSWIVGPIARRMN